MSCSIGHFSLLRAARSSLPLQLFSTEILPSGGRTGRGQFHRRLYAQAQVVEELTYGAPRVETGPQLTLSRSVTKSGIGLHSGELAEVSIFPAAAGEGRCFVLRNSQGDDRHPHRVSAALGYVRDTTLSTWVGGVGNKGVRTVEHLLSALEGMGVDNCLIEVTGGNEVPLLDGSALQWVQAIEDAGLSTAVDKRGISQARKALVIKEPITVCHGDSFVAAFPSSCTRLTYGIDFPQVPAIGRQWFTWSTDDVSAYKREVAPARTFGIYEQVEQLQAAGLIKGGSLDNALVCSMETGWLNPPLRFPDEPCRHKLLDLIGDLALCAFKGHPGLPIGHIVAYKASHSLHVKFGEVLLQRGK
ncbi:hypothetical protein R1flu_026712 [Riccia fluitans]|uniref:UDP-3-O-acyl-N-acetylglucosamine deacetylase n=1 Tax=Riccia fluitans TaxID=41844 RepID=A0ABD1XGP1_9MARC